MNSSSSSSSYDQINQINMVQAHYNVIRNDVNSSFRSIFNLFGDIAGFIGPSQLCK